MSRAGRLTVVMACALLVNCSGSSENPLADELTADQQALLIERSIDQIESTENYTPDNFEQLQRTHFETMTEEMRDAALEYLQKRLDKIMILEMSQTVELDRESAEVEVAQGGSGEGLGAFHRERQSHLPHQQRLEILKSPFRPALGHHGRRRRVGLPPSGHPPSGHQGLNPRPVSNPLGTQRLATTRRGQTRKAPWRASSRDPCDRGHPRRTGPRRIRESQQDSPASASRFRWAGSRETARRPLPD